MKQLLLVAFVLAGLAIVWACGPEFEVAVFSYKKHPDFPRTEFLDGKLGILQPTYARSYLVIAYRHISGVGLSAREKEQVRDYWKDRQTTNWDKTGTVWLEHWIRARNRVSDRKLKLPGGVSRYQFRYDYDWNQYYENCAEDAYRTATRTLEDRVATLGVHSRAVNEWLKAQDEVFSNCSEGKATIPVPAASDLPQIIRSDRAYQIAAAQFYSGQHQQAEAAFRKIAADKASPWRRIAPYLVVRTMLREGQSSYVEIDRVKKEGLRVLANPQLAYLHGMTRVMLHRADILDNDQEYFLGLARDLVSPGQDADMREELWSFTTMFDRLLGDNLWRDEREPGWEKNLTVIRSHDLTDWIYTFQSKDPGDSAHAVQRWRRSRSPRWLVAALSKVEATNPAAADLLKASAEIPPDSPAYLTVAFHRYRLMIDSGAGDDARRGLDDLLDGKVVPLPKSSINQLRSLRMLSAPSLPEFLQFAQRLPVMITWTVDQGEVPYDWAESHPRADVKLTRLDRDSVKVLNEGTPLRLWVQAAKDAGLPQHLRREFALAAFTRGLLLEDEQAMGETAALLTASMPEAGHYLDGFKQATDAEGRHFAGLFLVLHYPESRPYLDAGLGRDAPNGRIESYRDNWWLPMDVFRKCGPRPCWHSRPDTRAAADQTPVHAGFLTDAEVAQSRQEFESLVQIRSAPSYLSSHVLAYAKAHPTDSRVPEALHLVVRAARYSYADQDAWKGTRAAFQLLHNRYPKDLWTRKTPLWFKDWFTTEKWDQTP